MNRATAFAAFLLLISPLTAPSGASAAEEAGLVSGRVRGEAEPLPQTQVYAYQLADLSLRKVVADNEGRFAFERLPTGLYKIVAFKPGFMPGVALLTRASAQAAQFLEVELQSREAGASDSTSDFWEVRKRIPTDVLRDIDLTMASTDSVDRRPRFDRLKAEMRAVTGVDSLATAEATQVSGGEVDFESAGDGVNVDVSGRYLALESTGGLFDSSTTAGYSQALSVDLSGVGSNRIQVTSIDNSLGHDEDQIGLQSHRLSWSRDIGERGRSVIAAQYTEESNFYAGGGNAASLALPSGSRTWNLEGSYTTAVSERSTVEAGFNYRDMNRDLDFINSEWLGLLPTERVEIFGRAGTTVHPSVLVEYGVYSTMRDGTVSLMPQGGVVMQLGDDWRASTSASLKVHDDPLEARRINDFHTGYFRDYASCERAAAECYQLVLSHFDNEQEKLSIGAVHRRFDESLRLHFDQNFFNYHENLQLVHGDAVPELQFSLLQRLSPNVNARLQSNLGAGGGGLLVLADSEHQYENEVRYLVTSVDTQFENSATGVFVAFHHLQQRLNPVADQPLQQLMELERLQLMLTQNLSALSSLASDWAVQLNMEVSRGSLPDRNDTPIDDELRSRITGGLAVKF